MNPHEIDRLLRASPPDPPPPPGLETRIRAALHAAPRPAPAIPRALLAGFAAVALAAAAWVATRPHEPPPPAVAEQPPPPVATPPPPEAAPFANPLRAEVRALRNDAGRAGRFMLDCLPSLTVR